MTEPTDLEQLRDALRAHADDLVRIQGEILGVCTALERQAFAGRLADDIRAAVMGQASALRARLEHIADVIALGANDMPTPPGMFTRLLEIVTEAEALEQAEAWRESFPAVARLVAEAAR